MGECNSKSEDKWKKQHDKYQLYQLIKIEGGGELLNDYQKGGKFLSEEVIKEKLKEYLYSPEDGETKEIEPYENCKDLDANKTHKACWKREKELRGGVGETILHVCFLKGTEDHKEIAKSILECYPNLVLDIYEEDEYYGESCLHLAIVNNDLESVKMLDEKKAVLDQRATGRFFKRNNQKGGLLAKHSGYGGHAYYGEYPLHFAASVGNIDIYNYFVEPKSRASEQGEVNPNAQDSYGNTALHMAVIHNKLDMYKNITRNKTSPNQLTKNKDGLTVMGLAGEEGRSEIFEAMLDDSSDTAWEFGPVKCVTYPLEGVDSIKEDGGLDLNSTLWRTVFGGEDGHLDILESGVIYLLLKEKWKEFAKQKLRIRFILALFYLTMLSVAVYLRPEGDLLSGTTVTDIVRYIAEVIVLIGSTIYLGFEYFNIKALQRRYWRLQIYIPAKSTFLVSCVLFLFCLPFRLLSLRSVEDILTTLAVPMAWCYLLLFYRGREELGPFVTTIYKMALGDLLPFSLIWIVIISILCSVFYYPYKDMEGIQSFDTFYGSWMYLFHMTFEDFETLISGEDDEIELSRLPVLTKILFVIFMVLIPILLMNVLIAKMAQTYQTIEHRAWRESLRQWARIIMVLEHSCSKAELKKYRKAYAVPGAKPKYWPKGTSTSQPSPRKADAEDSEFCDSLMIVKPNFRVQQQKPHGYSSIRTRLSLQNWTVVPKATRKQLIEQKRHGAKIEETTVNWIDSLPGSGL